MPRHIRYSKRFKEATAESRERISAYEFQRKGLQNEIRRLCKYANAPEKAVQELQGIQAQIDKLQARYARRAAQFYGIHDTIAAFEKSIQVLGGKIVLEQHKIEIEKLADVQARIRELESASADC